MQLLATLLKSINSKLVYSIENTYIYMNKEIDIATVKMKVTQRHLCEYEYIAYLLDKYHLVRCTTHGTEYIFEQIHWSEKYDREMAGDLIIEFDKVVLVKHCEKEEFLMTVN